MTNVEMCQRTLAWILDHPEHHDQKNWKCGTKMCVAGVAIMLNTVDEAKLSDLVENSNKLRSAWRKAQDDNEGNERQGREILDLTLSQSRRLFSAYQSNDNALSYLKELINEAESSDH